MQFHVTRAASGGILSVAREASTDSELLDESHPDVVAFLGLSEDRHQFNATDAEFVRVIEDLIDTLIVKNIIRHTDLPEAAQRKLVLRKGMRSRMQGALDLLENDDGLL